VEREKIVRSVKIFYAWEDDLLPRKFNRYGIKNALTVAGQELEEYFPTDRNQPIKVVIDEATRDLPGSPHIPTAILEKIQSADVFVADVSAINSAQTDESKKTPNPNVVFELGYAVAYLGWERVILLVNEIHGPVTALPFDFDRHRASPFKLANGVGSQDCLRSLLRSAISLILEKDPRRPRASQFDQAQAQRERDLSNLRLLLQSIPWPAIDDHIARGAKFLSEASTILLEEVDYLVSSSSFHLYDGGLRTRVRQFVEDWRDSMKYDHYVERRVGSGFIFMRSDYPAQQAKELADWKYMDEARRRLLVPKDSLLTYIRTKFPEIDIRATSEDAAARYNAAMAEADRSLDEAGPKTKEHLSLATKKFSSKKRNANKLNKGSDKKRR
jgi:hypothetical protein